MAGRLRFDSKRMWSDDLQALFLDAPVKIDLQSDMDVARLSLDGNLDIQQLVAPYVSVDWRHKIHGKSRMNVRVINTLEKEKMWWMLKRIDDPKVQRDFPEPLSVTERDNIPMHFTARYVDDIMYLPSGYARGHVFRLDTAHNEQVFHAPEITIDGWMLPNVTVRAGWRC